MDKLCSWHILGQSLHQMASNREHRQKNRQRDGWWCSHWFENKRVLSLVQKAEEGSDSLSARGRAFLSLEAELEKALKSDCSLALFPSTLGIQWQDWEDDGRGHGGSWWGISFWRYCGAVSLKCLYGSERISFHRCHCDVYLHLCRKCSSAAEVRALSGSFLCIGKLMTSWFYYCIQFSASAQLWWWCTDKPERCV